MTAKLGQALRRQGDAVAEVDEIKLESVVGRSHVGTVIAIGRWLILAGTALSALVVVGYLLAWRFLWRPWPDDPATHPFTATLILLLGLALVCRGHRSGGAAVRRIFLIVMAAALVRLVEITAGTSLVTHLYDGVVGRAAENDVALPIVFGWRSASTILLLCVSGLLRSYRRDMRAQLVGVLALAQPLIALAGYALHQSDFVGQMAPFTALSLIALALGNLLTQAHRGFLKSVLVPSRVSRTLLLGLVLPAVIPYFAALVLVNFNEAAWVNLLPLYVVVLSLTMMASPILLATRLREIDAERRKLDHMVARHVETLKRQMVEREYLRQRAEAASEAKSTFLASMSHELRTPLNAVLGYSELVLAIGSAPAEKVAEYVTDIQNAGRHLLSLVDNVLDLVRIESGTVSLNPQRVHLRQTVSQIIRMQRLEARKNGVTIGTRLERNLTALYADDVALRQVLLNLVSNAVTACAAGGHVRISAIQPSAEWVEIVVQDNGPGMPPELMERIGEPFLRAGSAYNASAFGAGLGLAIVKRLMGAMGGEMSLRSDNGIGTTVTLRFQARRAAPEAAGPSSLSGQAMPHLG